MAGSGHLRLGRLYRSVGAAPVWREPLDFEKEVHIVTKEPFEDAQGQVERSTHDISEQEEVKQRDHGPEGKDDPAEARRGRGSARTRLPSDGQSGE